MISVENRLKIVENELRALKRATEPNIGMLKFPSSTPTASYSGSFPTTSQDLVAARLAATFTRTDGGSGAPLVDFAFDTSVSPTQSEYLSTQGITYTGNDTNTNLDEYVQGYEYSITDTSVVFYIDFQNAFAYYPGASATLSVTVQALATVPGTLTIERLI